MPYIKSPPQYPTANLKKWWVEISFHEMRIYDRKDVLKRETRETRSRFVRALIKYGKLYCKYTKLAGFKYFTESSTTWFDRTVWFLLYAFMVPTMVYTVYYSYVEFMKNPVMTSVETEFFPTYKLNFPGN
nr:PREDICTED: uncharacterized protein LOC105661740 [Megachile rotundata]